jgi:putative transcriptional regulator
MSVFRDLMDGLDEMEAHLDGKRTGAKVHLPENLDVKGIRSKLHMTQVGFANTFGFSVDAVRHWEAGRRTPEASARAFLTVIAHDPKMVIEALAATATAKSAGNVSVQRQHLL